MVKKSSVGIVVFWVVMGMLVGCERSTSSSVSSSGRGQGQGEVGGKGRGSLSSKVSGGGREWVEFSPRAWRLALRSGRPVCLFLYKSWGYEHLVFERRYGKFLAAGKFSLIRADVLRYPELEFALVLGRGRSLPMWCFFTSRGRLVGQFYGFPSRTRAESFFRVLRGRLSSSSALSGGVSSGRGKVEGVELSFLQIQNLLDILSAPSRRQRLGRDIFGGFGRGGKVFHGPVYRLFLLYAHRQGAQILYQHTRQTLYQMYISALFDRLDGGFHRCARARDWNYPLFEKDLSTNAQILEIASRVWVRGEESFLKEMVESIFDFFTRRLKRRGGGYFVGTSALGRDEVEPRSYLWTREELLHCLSAEEARVVLWSCGFEGDRPRPLYIKRGAREVARRLRMSQGRVLELQRRAFRRLFAVRRGSFPAALPVISLAANGQAAVAFFTAYQAFGEERYLKAGRGVLDFLRSRLQPEGYLRRWEGGEPYLGDQVEGVLAFLKGYECTLDRDYLKISQRILDYILQRFWLSSGRFGFRLGGVLREFSLPEGVSFYLNGRVAYALLRMYYYTRRKVYREVAERVLRLLSRKYLNLGQFASIFALGLDLYLYPPLRVVIHRGLSRFRKFDLLRRLVRLPVDYVVEEGDLGGGILELRRGKKRVRIVSREGLEARLRSFVGF